MSPKPNLLITGASGLLGSSLATYFSDKYNVLGLYNQNKPVIINCELRQVDLISNIKDKFQSISDFKPDIIIHCAGDANVDRCEKNYEHAKDAIFNITKDITDLAKKYSAYLITISTDAVFDGESEYSTEEDTPSPINVYGELKINTEEYVQATYPPSLIVRTRFYGTNVIDKMCFTEFIIDALEKNNDVQCFTDNYCTQIYTINLAQLFDECIQKKLSGLYNIVEDQKYSRYDYAVLVAKIFNLNAELIKPSLSSTINWIAARPRDTSLSNLKIKSILETPILTTEQGLIKMREAKEKCN